MRIEQWRPIGGLEGRYEVSDLGRVRSLLNNRCNVRAVPRLRRLRRRPADGYVDFVAKIGRRSTHYLVHRLVLEAFVGPCPSGMECAHENGDNGDNRLENLRWATPKENTADRDAHGTTPRGERNKRAKLTSAIVTTVRRRWMAGGVTISALSREYEVSRPVIKGIVVGRSWRHVPMPLAEAAL